MAFSIVLSVRVIKQAMLTDDGHLAARDGKGLPDACQDVMVSQQ